MHIKITVLEDNPKDYASLEKALREWATLSGNTLSVRWLSNPASLHTEELKSDCQILFSDIELVSPNGTVSSGIEVCKKIRQEGFEGEIIFLTAFREYVYEGYDVQAFHYLLKPLDKRMLFSRMDKYQQIHQPNHYCLHKGNDIILIPYNDIISITRAGHDIQIQTDREIYTQRASLSDLEKQLPPQLIRCHKSCIVNVCHIRSIVGNTLYLKSNQTQTISRNYLDNVRKAIVKICTE